MSGNALINNPEPNEPHAIVNLSSRLPLDIENHARKLEDTRSTVAGFGNVMDKCFFGLVGLDPVISAVPLVGDAVAALLCLWLLVQAQRVSMPTADKMAIFGLAVVDATIGFIPVAGDIADIFFRGHLWSAQRVTRHIDAHLALIEDARRRVLASPEALPDDHELFTQLRDVFFRGGKSQHQVFVRLIVGVVCLLAILAYCSFQDYQRRQQVSACEARGGWFCSSRY